MVAPRSGARGGGRIAVENVIRPGKTYQVDATKYEAMRRAVLQVLPRKSPGLTVGELSSAVLPRLPEDVFPGGAKAGWWLKAVQLDLEAKGTITREPTKPLRLRRGSAPG